MGFPDRVGADSLSTCSISGKRINLGDYDLRQRLARTHNTTDQQS
ncbi:hypothetical protein CAT723_04890 [Corynebacterium ammoniagenes]|uniref:Uncharacterized protein n=1 Tax=Corynebacterium ammoniagenes TaxID=1697 RepID=A0AAV5G6X6_CORAM|nr:hypothetical protein CAT723_04890 [Corynebacterium ammoniagenes]